MIYEIKSWYDGKVLYSAEADSLLKLIELAVSNGASLDGAALLAAGGKPLDSFEKAWQCHSWENCPMAHAFDVTDEKDTPLLLHPRVRQFVQLFDAKLIPWPLPTPTEGK